MDDWSAYREDTFEQLYCEPLCDLVNSVYSQPDFDKSHIGKKMITSLLWQTTYHYMPNFKFEQLLERIREIRASERMAYQKITDIYATACDYQRDAVETREFYAKVQNKLHWAIVGQTAAEIIYYNVDATKLHMGLTTWAQAPDGKIMKSDVAIAKNYLSEEHMRELNRIVEAYINLAETRAKNHRPTTMQQWAEFLDNFLTLASYPILMDKGKISALQAKLKAYEEYDKYRVIQDRMYLSDFDMEVKRLKGEMGIE